MLRIALCFIVCMSMVARAGTPDKEANPQPRSPTAREAIIRFEKTVKEADMAFKRTYAEANKKVLIDLEQTKRLVMKDGNLDEANRIDMKIRALQTELQDLLNPPKPADPTTTPIALKPTTQAVRFQGKCTYKMNESGFEGWFTINAGTIMVPPATPVQFQRNGNTIRAFWPNGDAVQYDLNGYDFTIKLWVKGASPFVGKPTFTGAGQLLH
jgi:hypothetical protein